MWSAAPGERSEVRGRLRYHPDRSSTDRRPTPSTLLAPNPRARGARRASDVGPRSDPHSTGQQSDPRSGRPAGAGWAALRQFRFWGANDRSIMLPPPAARWEVRGIAKQAALKDQGYRTPSTLLAPNPRARGARRASDVGPRSDPHSTGQQSDPRSGRPAGAGWAALRQFRFWGANDRSIMLPPPAARWEVRGIAKQAALKDQGYRTPSTLLAPNPRARGARRASDVGPRSDPHSTGQQSDPRSGRPAGAGWAALRQFRFWGANDRSIMLPPPAARWEVRGIAKQAALKDQGYRTPSTLLAPNPRARGARRASDVGPRSDPHSTGQQSDPRSGRPAGAGWAALRQFRFWGANDRSIMLPPPAARWEVRGIAKQAALKDQGYRTPSTLLAPNPRARGARRASDVGPRSDPHSTGQQSDPRSGRPAGAGWAALRQFRFWGANDRSIMLPPPAARWEVRGIAKQAALKDQGYRTPSTLLAPNPRARGARRASDVGPRSDPHSTGQQSDPRSGRPAGAGWAALRQFRFWGANDRSIMLPPPAARWEVRGIAKQAALKDQGYRTPSTLLAPNPRARGARRASDVGPRSDPHSTGQQSDPRSGRPAGAGWAALRQFRFWGANDRSIMLPPPAARWI